MKLTIKANEFVQPCNVKGSQCNKHLKSTNLLTSFRTKKDLICTMNVITEAKM